MSKAGFAAGLLGGIAEGLQERNARKLAQEQRQREQSLQAVQFLLSQGADVADLEPHLALAMPDVFGEAAQKKGKGAPGPQDAIRGMLARSMATEQGPARMATGPFIASPSVSDPNVTADASLPSRQAGPAVPPPQPRMVMGVPIPTPEQRVDREVALTGRKQSALTAQDMQRARDVVALANREGITISLEEVLRSPSFQMLPARQPVTPRQFMNVPPGNAVLDTTTGEQVFSTPAREPNAPNLTEFEQYLAQYAKEKNVAVADLTTAQLEDARKRYNQADDRPSQTSTEGAERRQAQKDLRARQVQMVLDNPAAWDNLTPTVQAEIGPDLAEQGFSGFGRQLSDVAVKRLSDARNALGALKDLEGVLKENEQYIGPIAGLARFNPYSDARKAQARIDVVRQRVGKALEEGVLRKEDEAKYKNILATLSDEPSTAIYKTQQLQHDIERDMQNYLNELRMSGRRVPAAGADAGGDTDAARRLRARQALQGAGKQTDDATIDLFLKNNPTFR